MKHNHYVIKKYVVLEKESIITWDTYEAGEFFQWINSLLKLLIIFQKDIAMRGLNFIFMAEIFFKMQKLV